MESMLAKKFSRLSVATSHRLDRRNPFSSFLYSLLQLPPTLGSNGGEGLCPSDPPLVKAVEQFLDRIDIGWTTTLELPVEGLEPTRPFVDTRF